MKIQKFLKCLFLLIGFTVHRSKSDSIRNGIIMNGANEAAAYNSVVDGFVINTGAAAGAVAAVADGFIDKEVVQQQENVVDVSFSPALNGSTQQQFKQEKSADIDNENNSDDIHGSKTKSNKETFDEYFNEFMVKNSDMVVIRSPPHMDNIYKTWKIQIPNHKRVEVIVHLLDINPFTNFLYIGGAIDKSNDVNLTAPISPENVRKIQINDINELGILFQFATSESSKYQGFVLTYKLLDKIEQISVDLPRIVILLDVIKANQTDETWSKFRLFLSQSANKLISAEKLDIEQSSVDNVTFVEISRCPTAWQKSENCVKIDFAIYLRKNIHAEDNTATKTQGLKADDDVNAEPIKYELSVDHLLQMWLQYGRNEFAINGFQEFAIPDTKRFMLIWIAICLAIILTFLSLLICVWKMDILEDYRRMYWTNSEDKKRMCKISKTDISMYPSAHQIVPTLFPNEVLVGMTGLPFEYVHQPITFSENDFKRRGSVEESLHPDNEMNKARKSGMVPFQSYMEFHESHSNHPEDEISLSNINPASTAPQSRNKFRASAKDESMSC